MRVKMDDILAFVTIVETGGFARAAEALNITQSALSRRIKKLEEALGTTLLDRTTRSVSVSIIGREFLPEAVRIVDEFNRSISDLSELVQVRKGLVSIATNMTLSDTLLPEILARYRAENPNIRIRVTESSSPRALERVLRRECELSIAQFGEGHPDLAFEPLFDDRFVVICRRDHPLSNRKRLTWEDLEGENFIRLRPESGTSNLLERSLGPEFKRLGGDIEVGHFNALLSLVGKGLGVSAVPTLVKLKRTDLDLVSLPIEQPVVSRSLGIITHRGKSLSPAGEKMREITRAVLCDAAGGQF